MLLLFGSSQAHHFRCETFCAHGQKVAIKQPDTQSILITNHYRDLKRVDLSFLYSRLSISVLALQKMNKEVR